MSNFESLAQTVLDEVFQRHPTLNKPVIEWKGYRVTAGMAYYRTNIIGLSRTVLKTPEAVRSTLIHEYAHLLTVDRYGRKAGGHGPEWVETMRLLGAEPKVRHNYEVERNEKRQEVIYRCRGCGATIVRRRLLPRKRLYVHASCGGKLQFEYLKKFGPPPKIQADKRSAHS